MHKEHPDKIIDLLEQLIERQIKHVLVNFQGLSEEELNKPPDANSWSISQCIQHINTYGDYYHPLLEQELLVERIGKRAGKHNYSRLGKYFIEMMDEEKSSKKRKAMKRHLPEIDVTAHKVISTHLDQQEKLISYVRKFSQLDTSRKSIATSITRMIKLNPIDVLHFLVVHNGRHINQAARIYSFENL